MDENLPVEVAQQFSNAGHDAKTVVEQHMTGVDDPRIIETCKSEGRVLVTLDLDFANTRAYPPNEYPGIIVFRVRRSDKNNLQNVCANLLPLLDKEQVSQRLWIVEETRVRIRGED